MVPDEEQDLVGALPAMSPTSRQRKLQADKNYQREARSLQLQSNMSVKSGLACTLCALGVLLLRSPAVYALSQALCTSRLSCLQGLRVLLRQRQLNYTVVERWVLRRRRKAWCHQPP